MKIVGIFLFVVAVHITKNSALFCFNCEKVSQRKCKAATFLIARDCPQQTKEEYALGLSPHCTKTIKHYSNGSKLYDRGCTYNLVDDGTDFCTQIKRQDENTECYICATDSCNGAYQNLIRFWIFILALIIALYIQHIAYNR